MTAVVPPFSPPAERNKAPILELLRAVLPGPAKVLEIASGTGQHAAYFCAARPDWDWQPTDADPAALPGIAAQGAALPNRRAPLRLDVLAEPWPVPPAAFDAVYCANMIHIAPWSCAVALLRGAARHLRPAAVLVLYGPFFVDAEATAASNLAFDADLRARDPAWGLRQLRDVLREASAVGLEPERRVAMPANNLALVLRRGADDAVGPTTVSTGHAAMRNRDAGGM